MFSTLIFANMNYKQIRSKLEVANRRKINKQLTMSKPASIVAAPQLFLKFFRALAPSPDYCGVPVCLTL